MRSPPSKMRSGQFFMNAGPRDQPPIVQLVPISARIDPRDPIAVAIEDLLLDGRAVIAIRRIAVAIRIAVPGAISVVIVIRKIAAVIRTRRNTETDTGRCPA